MSNGTSSPIPGTPRLSVAICTRNRSALLDQAISSLAKTKTPLSHFEILIVNNGSSDNTEQVIERWQKQLPNLRSVIENEAGLSCARNRALKEAAAPWIAFTDDDVRIPPNWIDEILAEINSSRTDAICGPIELEFESKPEPWLNHKLPRSYLAEFNLGSASRFLNFPETPFGANMAIQKELAIKIGGFSTQLGRRGNSLVSCEEIDFFHRFNAGHYRCFYRSTAKVLHFVERERMTKQFLRKRVFAQGISESLMAQLGPFSLHNEIRKTMLSRIKLLIIHFIRRKFDNFLLWQLEFFRVSGFFYGELTSSRTNNV